MTVDLSRHRSIHFIGICGAGMSALARLLHEQGYGITGSDRAPGETGDELRRAGIAVSEGHDKAHLEAADLVVVSSAVAATNEEVQAARDRHVPVIKRAELLGAIANAGRGIAVAGTHGKTTTSALIGHILTEAGLDPTVLVGGISASLGSNARHGHSSLVVVEADEYDASFLQLHPAISVITNVEADHLDFYGSADAIAGAFRAYAGQVTDTLVICADDRVLPSLVAGSQATIQSYGLSHGKWRAVDLEDGVDSISFTVRHGDIRLPVVSPLLGRHNVLNALAALIVAHELGVALETAAHALAGFRGVQRRGEHKGERAGVLVIDDYAHHPSEIRATLMGLQSRYQRPLRVVFQPHTYSRTHALLDEFAQSFAVADAVYLLDIYAARETNTSGVSSSDLERAATEYHAHVHYNGTAEEALQNVREDVRPGDIVVTMGAGDVTLLGPRILDALSVP